MYTLDFPIKEEASALAFSDVPSSQKTINLYCMHSVPEVAHFSFELQEGRATSYDQALPTKIGWL